MFAAVMKGQGRGDKGQGVFFLLSCIVAHVLLANWVGPAWWVPDLTLIGCVLVVATGPSRWLPISAAAGGMHVLWTVRFAPLVFAGCLAVGWGTALAAQQWDTSDRRVQRVLVALATVVMVVWLIWLEDLWCPAVLWGASVRVLSTTLAAFLLQRLLAV